MKGEVQGMRVVLWLLLAVVLSPQSTSARIVVVGSLNADTFLHVPRLPVEGENLTSDREPTVDLPGGKGCTQAIAVRKLLEEDGNDATPFTTSQGQVSFVCQFGADAVAQDLRRVLEEASVDISSAGQSSSAPSGRGYVFLSASGQVSAVVSGGSNLGGWKEWEEAWESHQADPTATLALDPTLDRILDGCRCLMLQREIPEYVNELLASKARARGNIIVLQDVGGEDRPMSAQHMACCDYLMPNETELCRLVASLEGMSVEDTRKMDTLELAKRLQAYGASHVVVTQGSRGATLLTAEGQVHYQSAIPAHQVVDETGAGDCFRAGFAVALTEGRPLDDSLAFACAAGCLAVETQGAVPSAPNREAVLARWQGQTAVQGLRGGGEEDDFPFLIGSRLNSMKDRPELWEGPLETPRDFVRRQGTVKGLTCVDFNYPQHFGSHWTVAEAKQALQEAGLVAGAVCLRYPVKFARGAMNHPDPAMRREAIELTKEAAQAALDLGCREVVVWSAYDGYDYPFQCDYDTKWQELVTAFQECCDAFPEIRFSVEYKPTDENTRFFTIPSTGAALLMVHSVGRTNFGLTLDVGHMLMAGENPAQSIAMTGRNLFGIQLNDGFTRLAAEDGLMFGSVHPSMALEIMYQLRRSGFDGHLYFDTFPQRSDPVLEAEYNIRRVKAFYHAAGRLTTSDKLTEIQSSHDAIGALELVDDALKNL
jgi:sugar/nucleoside kinase (ribokinase family)/sugar phosphate isomerase/epimerase